VIFARVRTADLLTAAAGLVLLVSLFLEWYERPEGAVTAWGAFGLLDLLLALVALLAIALPFVTAARDSPAVPVAVEVIVVALAFLVAPFLIYRLIDAPGQDADLSVGALVGAVALLTIFATDAIALKDERAPAIRDAGPIPVLPAPPS